MRACRLGLRPRGGVVTRRMLIRASRRHLPVPRQAFLEEQFCEPEVIDPPQLAVVRQPTYADRPKRDRLKRARLAAGMTQYELARASGLTITTIANLEGGRTQHPRYETMDAIARVLGCELSALKESWDRGITVNDPHMRPAGFSAHLAPSLVQRDDFIPQSILDQMDNLDVFDPPA